MTNVTSEREKPAIKFNPNQTQWIENKFGHLRPLIRAAGRIIEKEDRPSLQSQEA